MRQHDLPSHRNAGGGAGVDKHTVSDHREGSFGKNYGVLISGGPLIVWMRERCLLWDLDTAKPMYVRDIAEQPNYEAALAAAR